MKSPSRSVWLNSCSKYTNMTHQSNPNSESDFFGQLKLQVGDRLQIELPSSQHDQRYFTTLVGYVSNLSVLVRNPIVNGLSLAMRDHEKLIVRGFSGLETFSFETTVERVCLSPFPYLHLAYPHTVRTIPVRNEVRVKIRLPVKITTEQGGNAIQAIISNMSSGGIQIDSEEELGAVHDEISVSFHITIQPNDYQAHIEARAIIQNSSIHDNHEGGFLFQYGVKLLNLHSSQAILLQNLIYQTLLEDHHNIT